MNYKCLFIHISKCAGSSINTAPFILLHGSPSWSPQIPVEDNNLKFCFAFVRDPYTRFTSAVLGHNYATPENFEEWVLTVFKKEANGKFARWEWQELLPQHKYLVHNGKMDVDFIGKFENLHEDWKKVCDMAGEEFELPHKNKNKIANHADCHTEETREIVRQIYWNDFRLLNYKK